MFKSRNCNTIHQEDEKQKKAIMCYVNGQLSQATFAEEPWKDFDKLIIIIRPLCSYSCYSSAQEKDQHFTKFTNIE